MVSAHFLLQNSLERVRFFEKTFLLADISIEVVLEMPFLFFSNADVEFAELGKLIWRSYTTAKALPITSQVEFIDKKEFAKTVINKNSKTFVVYMSVLDATELLIHPFQAAQIATL